MKKAPLHRVGSAQPQASRPQASSGALCLEVEGERRGPPSHLCDLFGDSKSRMNSSH